ncbi:MAG: DHHA1 domain-containing protein, partial [Flavobacteriales bacterium]
SEGAVAAGVRRIEAITAINAECHFNEAISMLEQIRETLKQPKDVLEKIQQVLDENTALQAQVEALVADKARQLKASLIAKAAVKDGIRLIAEKVDLPSADAIKNLSFELKAQFNDLIFLAAAEIDGKAHLSLIISDQLVQDRKFNATAIIRDLAKAVQGGGGGQPFYATAGGKSPSGIPEALKRLPELLG